ncbi:hypothetical protein C265_11231 [Cupriavidus sp. GA3-3]|nr:hypothetical protein C265_11231 [Cupriavidus sp. GA3-3]
MLARMSSAELVQLPSRSGRSAEQCGPAKDLPPRDHLSPHKDMVTGRKLEYLAVVCGVLANPVKYI